jgi:hypothetical protein
MACPATQACLCSSLDQELLALAERNGFFSENSVLRRNANPGAVVRWRDYPRYGGYVDFVQWAADRAPGASYEEISEAALAEGWRIAREILDSKNSCGFDRACATL